MLRKSRHILVEKGEDEKKSEDEDELQNVNIRKALTNSPHNLVYEVTWTPKNAEIDAFRKRKGVATTESRSGSTLRL